MKKKVAVVLFEDVFSVARCLEGWRAVLPDGYQVLTHCLSACQSVSLSVCQSV